MRSCWTTGLQAPPLSGFNDCFEESNSEVKLSRGEVKKDDTCVAVWRGSAGGGGFDQLVRVEKMEADLSLHHQCNGNHPTHLYQSNKMYD